MPELAKLGRQIAELEEEYMPLGPPMSPITGSHFTNWTLLDLGVGLHDESLGSCVAAVSKAMGSDPEYVELVEPLCRTRPGVYIHQGELARLPALPGADLALALTTPYLIRSPLEAYVNHEADVIFLQGLPDQEESRPHSRVNSDRDLWESPMASGAAGEKNESPPHSNGRPGRGRVEPSRAGPRRPATTPARF